MDNVVAMGACRVAVRCWQRGASARATMVVKTTLALQPDGRLSVAEPAPLLATDVHRDGRVTSSLAAPSDMALFRPRADILLLGHARPPAGTTTTRCHVRLTVTRGAEVVMSKRLLVVGEQGDAGPVPFVSMPLDHEHAFGGPGHADNPIGRGVGPGPAPTVLDPQDASRTACYAPLPAAWPVRRSRLKAPLKGDVVSVIEPFDWSYFQTAPPDQQTSYLTGDECVLVEGLHAQVRHLTIALPAVRAAAAVYGLDGRAREVVPLHADMLLLELDAGRVTLVWRGVVRGADQAAFGRCVFVAGVSSHGEEVVLPSERPPLVAMATPSGSTSQARGAVLDLSHTVAMTAPEQGIPEAIAPFALAGPSAAKPPRGNSPWKVEGSVAPASLDQAVTANLSLVELDEEIAAAKRARRGKPPALPQPVPAVPRAYAASRPARPASLSRPAAAAPTAAASGDDAPAPAVAAAPAPSPQPPADAPAQGSARPAEPAEPVLASPPAPEPLRPAAPPAQRPVAPIPRRSAAPKIASRAAAKNRNAALYAGLAGAIRTKPDSR